jgi:hypothetical protein
MKLLKSNKFPLIGVLVMVSLLIALSIWRGQQNTLAENAKAPGNDWDSPKRIEDYFVNDMRIPLDEAEKYADVGVSFYVRKDSTLDGIVGNLAYYGIVRDEGTLRYALKQTKDTVPGKDGAIKVDDDKTIDLAVYGLSRNMDTWQVADALLNKPHYVDLAIYTYLFMPGDPADRTGPRTNE